MSDRELVAAQKQLADVLGQCVRVVGTIGPVVQGIGGAGYVTPTAWMAVVAKVEQNTVHPPHVAFGRTATDVIQKINDHVQLEMSNGWYVEARHNLVDPIGRLTHPE